MCKNERINLRKNQSAVTIPICIVILRVIIIIYNFYILFVNKLILVISLDLLFAHEHFRFFLFTIQSSGVCCRGL